MTAIEMRAWQKPVDHRFRPTGSTSTRAMHSDLFAGAGWSVKRHVDDQQTAVERPEVHRLRETMMCLMLLDISRAHLQTPLARVVFVTIDGKVWTERCRSII